MGSVVSMGPSGEPVSHEVNVMAVCLWLFGCYVVCLVLMMPMAGKTELPNYWVNQRDKMGIARTPRNMVGFQAVVSLRHEHCAPESKRRVNNNVSTRRCAMVKQCVSVPLFVNVLFSRMCMYRNIARPGIVIIRIRVCRTA